LFFAAAKIHNYGHSPIGWQKIDKMGAKRKFYVVWAGRKPGVYDNWGECKEQVDHFDGAKYKSFDTQEAAVSAFREGYEQYYRNHPSTASGISLQILKEDAPKPILESLSVDAAWNTVTKMMEYRGVYVATREVWFHKGPFPNASNNIGEFLALVHGIALCKQRNLDIPIYTDSITAMAWVRHKKHKSIILPTEENAVLFDMMTRAENWLRNNTYDNPIYKWNTPLWGEIPADFGRK
jgi:ribonuclease HI